MSSLRSMPIRRRTNPDGSKTWEVSSFVMHSLWSGYLLWVVWISSITYSNQITLGEGARFTEADGVRLHSKFNHIVNSVNALKVSLQEARIAADQDRRDRSDLRAEFQLFRAELREHADQDDRRFGVWRRGSDAGQTE